MPVKTRSQIKLDNTHDEPIRAYKLVNLKNDTHVLIPAIAVLLIPDVCKTTLSRKLEKNSNNNYVKYRADCVFVEDITDLNGDLLSEVKYAYSIYKPQGCIENTLMYTKGQFVYPDHYNKNIDDICGGGIHFFKSIEAVIGYYIKGTNSKYDNFKIYPGVNPIHYSFYKEYVPDGKYNIFSGQGIWIEEVKYEKNMLKEYNFILNHTHYSTKFSYCMNSMTNKIVVTALTFEKNHVGHIYKVIRDIKLDNFPTDLVR